MDAFDVVWYGRWLYNNAMERENAHLKLCVKILWIFFILKNLLLLKIGSIK